MNLDVVPQQAELLAESGVRGVFVAGSTGESQSLTVDERMALAECWAQAAADASLKLIVQVGHNCQQDAARLAAHAQQIGSDAVSCLGPGYFKPESVDSLIEFCAPIAAAASNTPFYYYHIPGLTGVELSMTEFLDEGRHQIPTLNGLKYTHMDLMEMQRCVRLRDGLFDILFGCDEALLAGLAMGAHGAIGTTYNFSAPLYLRIIDALERGDLASAQAEQARSVELIEILMRYDVLAATKSIMARMGIDCGPVRPPLANLSDEQSRDLMAELAHLDIFVRPLSEANVPS